MANFTQDIVVPMPAEVVPSWVKVGQVGIYTGVVLATVVTYDASELPKQLLSD